jgi:deazaflavin-dependent oxidoreductase (nitroreductase family)
MSDATPGGMNDFNKTIIEEFRANEGVVGGPFAGAPIVLLTTTGAKSGLKRTSPLVSYAEHDRLFIMASKGGAPDNPDWYHNLKANPTVTIEQGTETFEAASTEVPEPERSEIFGRVAELMPNFAEYEKNTDRKIPLIELKRS